MSAVATYIGRTFDVLALQGATASGNPTLAQSLFDSSSSGAICTGVQKLAQRWVLEFLTNTGSMGFNLSTRGTDFFAAMQSGKLQTELDVQIEFNFAALQAAQNLRNEETSTMNPEDRYGSVQLLQITISPDVLQLNVQINSLAGTSRQVILPISILPVNLTL